MTETFLNAVSVAVMWGGLIQLYTFYENNRWWKPRWIYKNPHMTATTSRFRSLSHWNSTPSSRYTTKDESIINLPLSLNTHTCTQASCCGEFIILSPLTCYVFLLSLNNAWNPVVHLEPAPGLFGFTSTCGGAPHVMHVCSRSSPPSLHNYDTYNLKNFLQQALCPHFYIINTYSFFIAGLFLGVSRPVSGTFFPCVL